MVMARWRAQQSEAGDDAIQGTVRDMIACEHSAVRARLHDRILSYNLSGISVSDWKLYRTMKRSENIISCFLTSC